MDAPANTTDLAAEIGHEPTGDFWRAMAFLRRCSNKELAYFRRDGIRRLLQERPVVVHPNNEASS